MGGVSGAFAGGGGGVGEGWLGGRGSRWVDLGGTCPLVHHRPPLPPLTLPLTVSRLNIGTELVGKALCFVTLLCLETVRQLLSSHTKIDSQKAYCGVLQARDPARRRLLPEGYTLCVCVHPF